MPFEETDVRGPIEQIARLASLHLTSFYSVFVNDVVQHRLFATNAAVVGLALEDFAIRARSRRLYARPLAHSSQKRLIRKIFLIEVCRKHHKLLKRHLDLLSCME